MNGKQRMALAMRHQAPDRVPLMCQLALGHYFVNMRDKWKPHQIWFTSEAFADSLVTLARRYQFDGILINIPGRDPNWLDNVAIIEETADGEWLTLKDGLRILVPWDDNPQLEPEHPERVPYPDYESFDPDQDLDRLDDFPRYAWGVYHIPYVARPAPGLLPDHFFRTIDLVTAAVGGTLSIHGEIFSPFTHFMELFGYQNALLGMATDPAKAAAILERLTGASLAWGHAQAAHGVDAMLISSAFAGGGFISPDMYERFVVPYERKVADALHESHPDVPVYTHTCGRLDDRLELLAQSHVDGIDTLDPPPLGNTKLADAKRRIGDRLFIKGNLNSVAILTDDETRFVERATRTLLTGKPGGGYILSTACSVAPHVEPWKMEKLITIVDEHGWYGDPGEIH